MVNTRTTSKCQSGNCSISKTVERKHIFDHWNHKRKVQRKTFVTHYEVLQQNWQFIIYLSIYKILSSFEGVLLVYCNTAHSVVLSVYHRYIKDMPGEMFQNADKTLVVDIYNRKQTVKKFVIPGICPGVGLCKFCGTYCKTVDKLSFVGLIFCCLPKIDIFLNIWICVFDSNCCTLYQEFVDVMILCIICTMKQYTKTNVP